MCMPVAKMVTMLYDFSFFSSRINQQENFLIFDVVVLPSCSIHFRTCDRFCDIFSTHHFDDWHELVWVSNILMSTRKKKWNTMPRLCKCQSFNTNRGARRHLEYFENRVGINHFASKNCARRGVHWGRAVWS